MKTKMKLGILAVYASTCLATSAWAARAGKVDAESAEVFENPSKLSRVIDTLKDKTPVAASNLPTNGYFKVRTPKGSVGWVATNRLSLEDIPSDDDVAEAEAKASENSVIEPPKPKNDEEVAVAVLKKYRGYHKYKVRALGGLNFFNSSGVLLSGTSLGPGFSYGLELGYQLSKSTAILLRGEMISSITTLSNAQTGILYSIASSSMPATAGLEFGIFQTKTFIGHFSLLGGLSIPNQISISTVSNSNSLGTLSSTNVTGIGKVDVDILLTKSISLIAEAGYRYAPSGTVSGGANNILLQSSFIIDFSGPFVMGGGSVSF